jgi:hypothetical protein
VFRLIEQTVEHGDLSSPARESRHGQRELPGRRRLRGGDRAGFWWLPGQDGVVPEYGLLQVPEIRAGLDA